jgi:hypothetical protein
MDEYVIAYDGEPRMDGTHARQQIGRFTKLSDAEKGLEIVRSRSRRDEKPNLRIEHRVVGPWTVVLPI